PPAEASCPDVTQVARWLENRFGNSRMSGSGSAVFARVIDDDNGTAGQPLATDRVENLPPGWAGRMCRSLDHHPLMGWSS
ncbi:MAG: 4-(cytidine 5'-diphospho)-2-C-methyl-D-erythritol kinase, partial [Aquabacterium sp.]|nr:4-(cytidine 5'-diphospho)-2-C-methyl-D-erythritol kinase [Aquabacterium sp.]